MTFQATEEALQVLNSSVSQLKWRLRSPAKRRLEIDVLALLTGMRPVIMVDYGGKMPELQDHLCALIKLCQQESDVFQCLRVMVVDDMIYLIHIKGLAEYAMTSLNSKVELLFVNLERDPPEISFLFQMVSRECPLGNEFLRVQKMFSLLSPRDELEDNASTSSCVTDNVTNGKPATSSNPSTSISDELVDLSSCMQETQITVPTLNGWLLGYPVVYLFGKDFIADAICNLSTKYLRLFRILVRWLVFLHLCYFFFSLGEANIVNYGNHGLCRGDAAAGKGSQVEELMSFSVPYELSMRGRKEEWAEAFLERLQMKWEKCRETWVSLEMEVEECHPQAIVL
ncbi:hypothetical protein LINPERHAP1_LOCUS37888 [Linum perenne]